MAKKIGRPKGSKSRGFFFRSGRGWHATISGRKLPLKDASGNLLKDEKTPFEVVQKAYARLLVANEPSLDSISVREVCQAYLDHSKATDRPSTYENRAGTLFDFCKGFAAGYRNKSLEGAKRLHSGYGDHLVSEVKKHHVTAWLNAHPAWKGARRTKIQAVKRAFNYAVEQELIPANPIKGFKTPPARARETFLDADQEKACYEHAKPALATAIRICIRTGARYGCEYATLTAKHVHFLPEGMEWRFSPSESKTKVERIIRISDPELIELVRRLIAKYPKGPLFRNTKHEPWTRASLGNSFTTLKRRLKKRDVELDADCCMYSTRHTYAKRALAGEYDGNVPITIEQLAGRMGNSREVCWKHYAKWDKRNTAPLWERR